MNRYDYLAYLFIMLISGFTSNFLGGIRNYNFWILLVLVFVYGIMQRLAVVNDTKSEQTAVEKE